MPRRKHRCSQRPQMFSQHVLILLPEWFMCWRFYEVENKLSLMSVAPLLFVYNSYYWVNHMNADIFWKSRPHNESGASMYQRRPVPPIIVCKHPVCSDYSSIYKSSIKIGTWEDTASGIPSHQNECKPNDLKCWQSIWKIICRRHDPLTKRHFHEGLAMFHLKTNKLLTP